MIGLRLHYLTGCQLTVACVSRLDPIYFNSVIAEVSSICRASALVSLILELFGLQHILHTFDCFELCGRRSRQFGCFSFLRDLETLIVMVLSLHSFLAEGIAKFTPKSHADYAAVTQFSKGINELLTNINDRLRRNEERLSMLSLYHEIGGAPVSVPHCLLTMMNVVDLICL